MQVFLYLDADCEPVITTDKPFAMVDEFAGLKVVNANKIGAFLDWGMKKDLVRAQPRAEQADAGGPRLSGASATG